MHHILILRALTKGEIELVQRLVGQKKALVFVDSDIPTTFDFATPYVKLVEEEKKSINYSTLSEVLDFGDTIVNGQPISKLLNFHGAGLWYYHKFRIYFQRRNLQYEFEEIKRNLHGATSAILFCKNTSVKAAQFSPLQFEIIPQADSKKPKKSMWSIVQYGVVATIRLLKSVFTPLSGFNSRQVVCIDTSGQYRPILSLDGMSTIMENAYLGYLYQKMGDQFGFIDQLLIPKFSGVDRYKFKLKHIKNHNNRERLLGERIMASGVISPGVLSRFFKTKRELSATYQMISNAVQSYPEKLQILNEFKSLHSTSLFYLLKYFCYLRFFRDKKFSTLLTTDENSPNFKIICDAAKMNGKFTVGYQHGSIHELHPAYIYTNMDLEQKPMPDLTITWGKKWNDLLIQKGNYLPDTVKPAGQIRTDIIKNLEENKKINKGTILSGIDQKHLILFATQPQRDPYLRYKAADDVVTACKNLESVHLVFKIHPRELDIDFYSDIAKKHQFENYTISTEEDLYILLKISDLVITCFSTVGTEALYFRKPLVILDHLKQDILHYKKDGVAFQAFDANELEYMIREVLAGRMITDKVVLEKYILDSAYKIDGRVSERVWDMLTVK